MALKSSKLRPVSAHLGQLKRGVKSWFTSEGTVFSAAALARDHMASHYSPDSVRVIARLFAMCYTNGIYSPYILLIWLLWRSLVACRIHFIPTQVQMMLLMLLLTKIQTQKGESFKKNQIKKILVSTQTACAFFKCCLFFYPCVTPFTFFFLWAYYYICILICNIDFSFAPLPPPPFHVLCWLTGVFVLLIVTSQFECSQTGCRSMGNQVNKGKVVPTHLSLPLVSSHPPLLHPEKLGACSAPGPLLCLVGAEQVLPSFPCLACFVPLVVSSQKKKLSGNIFFFWCF